MKLTKITLYFFLIIMLIGIAMIINAKAAPTGQIKGQLIDAANGNPVIGASVLIEGSKRGSMTDKDGRYKIMHVKPGIYNLIITHLDFQKITIIDVMVKSDITSEQNIKMVRKVTELDAEIKVTAKRELLDKFVVANEVRISKDRIAAQPVTTVDELLSSASGVATNSKGEVFIRGGKAGEVSYIVDGIAPNSYVYTPRKKVKRNPQIAPGGYYLPDNGSFSPAHGGTNIVNGEPFDAMFFKNYGVNPFIDTEDDHLSTFATDVDDASYIMSRNYLKRGELPPDEAIRVEEFVNHFDYNYKAPRYETFSVFVEGAPSYFGQNSQLLKIGIKGKEIYPGERKDANLVFVIDVSGSMDRENRLGLVKRSLRMLIDELTMRDKVGIVVYGSRGRVVLEPTTIRHDRGRILKAISRLYPEGATNAEEGLRLGYKMADRMFEHGKINRVILCSDGVANVGRTGPKDILKRIKGYAQKGITLSAIGFGMGNYNDVLMEKLGNKGNGSYAYVDDFKEAKRVFVDNLTGNLQVIARDVKIQVDFNPEIVRSYRLLGYENRDVADNKFRDDNEDGGEIGSGHEVTALYEIKLRKHAPRGKIGTVYVRYKDPDYINDVSEFSFAIRKNMFERTFKQTTPEFKLAACAAEFAEILRKSYWAKGSQPTDLFEILSDVRYELDRKEVDEFIKLIRKANRFEDELAFR